MKKALSILLALFLALSALSALAEQDAEPAAAYMDDFSVPTCDGGSFTLSEALKDHELVLLNFWATWCPPCAYEFPFLQEAWEKNSDRVAVIALSVEPKDTLDEVKAYAKKMGLTFPMGNVGDTGLDAFANQGTPTTVIVDKSGKILASELGVRYSAEDFEDLFEGYSGKNYNPEECTYTIFTEDMNEERIADVTLGFCTDTACRNVTTDENGIAVFKGAPAKYHIQVIDVPDGFSDKLQQDLYTEPYDQTFYILLNKE